MGCGRAAGLAFNRLTDLERSTAQSSLTKTETERPIGYAHIYSRGVVLLGFWDSMTSAAAIHLVVWLRSTFGWQNGSHFSADNVMENQLCNNKYPIFRCLRPFLFLSRWSNARGYPYYAYEESEQEPKAVYLFAQHITHTPARATDAAVTQFESAQQTQTRGHTKATQYLGVDGVPMHHTHYRSFGITRPHCCGAPLHSAGCEAEAAPRTWIHTHKRI